MLNNEQIKTHILQAEPLVREFAIEYFSESYSQDPELMPLVLESSTLPQYQGFNRLALLNSLRFVHTEETVAAIVQYLSGLRKNDNDVYEMIFSKCPVSLLQPYAAQINQLPLHRKEIVLRRMKLAETPTKELLDRLYALAEEGLGKFMNEFDYAHGVLMVKELATREDWDIEQVLSPLVERFEQIPVATPYDDHDGYSLESDYLQIYLTILAGEKRLVTAIPTLINILKCDGDLPNECAVEALTQIGTAEVIEQLQDSFAQQSWTFRLFAGSIFGKIKSTASEAALLRLLPAEKDETVQTNLAHGICQLLSLKGIPLVWKLIAEGYDSSLLDLKESLYINFTVNGLELTPELVEWKKQQDKKPEERQRSSFFPLAKLTQPVTSVKVGRNEPCPCGSGKKYKKCCGK